LLLDDRIDEWWLAHYLDHQGKKFQAITKGDVDVSKLVKEPEKVDTAQLKNDYDQVLKNMQTILADRVTEVRLSERLTDSPVCIVTAADDLSYNMQRIMSSFGQNVPKAKPILELNPKHKLVQNLRELIDKKNEKDEKIFAEWTNLFYEQALLIAGGKLENVAEFAARMNDLLTRSLL